MSRSRWAFSWALVAVVWAGLGSQAWAAPSLIVLEDNGESNSAYRQVMESLGAVIVSNNLGRYYDHIDLLAGASANRETLFAKIRKRGAKSDVDVVILTHGMSKRLMLGAGDITDEDIRAAGTFSRLRLVYMMACYSASLEDAWRSAGARVVLGHQDINSLPGFFFPRFLKRWGEGATVRQAAEEAYRFSADTAQLLSDFVADDRDYLSRLGIRRSEPVIQGIDMDRWGREYPDHALAIAPIGAPLATVALAEGGTASALLEANSRKQYDHTPFEGMGIAVMSAMVPQATLSPELIPSAQELVDRVHGVAWDQLRDSFPDPGDSIFSELSGLPTEDGQKIWIDGEALRYFLGSLREYVGDAIGPVMDRVQGVRLTRKGELLYVGIYFNDGFDISLKDKASAPAWQPFLVHVPKTIRFSILMKDGTLSLTGLDAGRDAVNLSIKMPASLSTRVWVRNATVNMTDGKARVEAGVLANALGVVANAQIMAAKLDGIDIWASIARNLNIFDFPTLHFQKL